MPPINIRPRALEWFTGRTRVSGHVVTSRRYAPDESWTKSKAWWLQIPLGALDRFSVVHFVCEAPDDDEPFFHLRVPSEFLKAKTHEFALIGGNTINLFLSADPGIEFQDQRGPGRVQFAEFLQ
jgi:hypothetical protein